MEHREYSDKEKLDLVFRSCVLDKEFRLLLISNPREALASFGLIYKPDVEIEIIEVPENKIVLPIPPYAGQIEVDSSPRYITQSST